MCMQETLDKSKNCIFLLIQVLTSRLFWMQKRMLMLDGESIIQAALNAVKPSSLIESTLKRQGNQLIVDDKEYTLNHNVYIIGFGKAVTGMASAVETIIGEDLVEGILSVPLGTRKILPKLKDQAYKKIVLYEGAANNLPDVAAYQNALKIVNLVKVLSKDHLIIALISGGGSALFPVPIPDITLEEKLQAIKLLSDQGASIQELNTVRQQLSLVKGGGLSKLCYPAKVISLILSDIIGDPLDLIASGPTIFSAPNYQGALEIMEKYNILSNIPKTIKQLLHSNIISSCDQTFENTHNVLIGNNSKALFAAQNKAKELGFVSLILTDSLHGEARDVGKIISQLIEYILNIGLLSKKMKPEEITLDLSSILRNFQVNDDMHKSLQEILKLANHNNKNICLLAGGETTVVVKGNGKGGRNQELALACSIEMNETLTEEMKNTYDVNVVSLGTDGQDGPTSAAGAIASYDVIVDRSSAREHLDNNDSYHFFKKANEGKNLIMTGLTGTNVMDIVLILIKFHN